MQEKRKGKREKSMRGEREASAPSRVGCNVASELLDKTPKYANTSGIPLLPHSCMLALYLLCETEHKFMLVCLPIDKAYCQASSCALSEKIANHTL